MSIFDSIKTSETAITKLLKNHKFTGKITMTTEEVKEMMEEMTVTVSTRTPEEIDSAVKENVAKALHNAKFALVPVRKEPVLKQDAITDESLMKDGLKEEHLEKMFQKCCIFAFLHGNVTVKKYWIKLGNTKEGKESVYFALPDLNAVGHRSNLVHVFKNYISTWLKLGMKNTLVTVLERSKVEIQNVEYLFPKGHLCLDSSAKDKIKAVRDDLNHIFTQLGKPVDQRSFKELTFFRKESKSTVI